MTGPPWRCNLERHRARGIGVRNYSFPVLQLITPLQADAALSANSSFAYAASSGLSASACQHAQANAFACQQRFALKGSLSAFWVSARCLYVLSGLRWSLMPGKSGGARLLVAITRRSLLSVIPRASGGMPFGIANAGFFSHPSFPRKRESTVSRQRGAARFGVVDLSPHDGLCSSCAGA
jgi:hypothetical protein